MGKSAVLFGGWFVWFMKIPFETLREDDPYIYISILMGIVIFQPGYGKTKTNQQLYSFVSW